MKKKGCLRDLCRLDLGEGRAVDLNGGGHKPPNPRVLVLSLRHWSGTKQAYAEEELHSILQSVLLGEFSLLFDSDTARPLVAHLFAQVAGDKSGSLLRSHNQVPSGAYRALAALTAVLIGAPAI